MFEFPEAHEGYQRGRDNYRSEREACQETSGIYQHARAANFQYTCQLSPPFWIAPACEIAPCRLSSDRIDHACQGKCRGQYPYQ